MEPARYIHTLVRAVIVVDGHVLLAHCKGASNTFLPGGHVAVGEGLKDGLSREIREELGYPIQIGRYFAAVEHKWGEGAQFQHEINHVFAASLSETNPSDLLVSPEAHLEFSWVQVRDLTGNNLRPYPLIDLIGRYVNGDRVTTFESTFAGP